MNLNSLLGIYTLNPNFVDNINATRDELKKGKEICFNLSSNLIRNAFDLRGAYSFKDVIFENINPFFVITNEYEYENWLESQWYLAYNSKKNKLNKLPALIFGKHEKLIIHAQVNNKSSHVTLDSNQKTLDGALDLLLFELNLNSKESYPAKITITLASKKTLDYPTVNHFHVVKLLSSLVYKSPVYFETIPTELLNDTFIFETVDKLFRKNENKPKIVNNLKSFWETKDLEYLFKIYLKQDSL